MRALHPVVPTVLGLAQLGADRSFTDQVGSRPHKNEMPSGAGAKIPRQESYSPSKVVFVSPDYNRLLLSEKQHIIVAFNSTHIRQWFGFHIGLNDCIFPVSLATLSHYVKFH